MESKTKWTGGALIAVILLITVLALGAHTFTKPSPNADETLQQHESVLRGLYPQSSAFERVESTEDSFVYLATQGGAPLGYAIGQTVQGYAGPVEVISAYGQDGTLNAIHVGGSGFSETEGLGARARDPEFTEQFSGKKPPLTLGKDVDSVSGATVTSQAVVDAVNRAYERLPQTNGSANGSSSASHATANASVMGYGGPVLVRLTLDENGLIAELDVGGARFAETEGIGSRVTEESFISTFIGKKPPLEPGKDVDTLAGATVSSRAVIEAVNEAAAFLSGNTAHSTGE